MSSLSGKQRTTLYLTTRPSFCFKRPFLGTSRHLSPLHDLPPMYILFPSCSLETTERRAKLSGYSHVGGFCYDIWSCRLCPQSLYRLSSYHHLPPPFVSYYRLIVLSSYHKSEKTTHLKLRPPSPLGCSQCEQYSMAPSPSR